MRVMYDTEFHSPGHFAPTELISIGIVRDDSTDTLHMVSNEFDLDAAKAHPFLAEHVLPQLPPQSEWRPLDVIRAAVTDFLQPHAEAELWAYYSAFDAYMLSNLFGTMLELPHPALMFTRDVKQEVERIQATARERGVLPADGKLALPEQAEGEHDALADARHLLTRFDWLSGWALDHGIEPPQ